MGALPKTTRPKRLPDYLEWLSRQPCVVSGKRNYDSVKQVEVHHLTRLSPMNRISRNDRYCVPLATELHNFGKYAVHPMGVTEFEEYHVIDLTAESERLWTEYCNEKAVCHG